MNNTLVKIAIALFALFYIIFPVDFLPDIIPIVGWVDDLVVGIGALWFWLKR